MIYHRDMQSMRTNWHTVVPCQRYMTLVVGLNQLELTRAFIDGGVFGSKEDGKETLRGVLIRHDAKSPDAAGYVAKTTVAREILTDTVGLGASFVAVAEIKVSIPREEADFTCGTIPGTVDLDYAKIVGEHLYGEVQQIDMITFPRSRFLSRSFI